MINGVKIKKIRTHSDNRGYFREILRRDDKIFKKIAQVSISLTKPGIIKAFHWHKNQDDVFYVLSGKALVILHDLRKKSKTYKQASTFLIDEKDQKLLFIPRKVAHGYKVLGKKPLILLYIMSNSYKRNKPDEQRIPYDSKEIRFDWSKYK